MAKSVILEEISKKYKMYNGSREKLCDLMFRKDYGQDFYALRDVSFEAQDGDVIGVVGVNGSGKSTLSNIIAGLIPPTSGTIQRNGEASMIAVKAGLDGKLTGRENIEMKCLMLGFDKEKIEQLEPGIIEFSEIEDFIDQPVKTYSSGMKARLGFAISINIDPDILVIDEALSVGDQTFTDKCLEKMNEFKKQGKTIFFVSHALGQMKKFCEKVIWLEYGKVRAYGPIDEIMPQYRRFVKEFRKMSKAEKKRYKQDALRRQKHEAYSEIV
ncbi:MAG TPA: teichoic acids export ABC transporter ATP-binding subunit TagH [Bacillales bacterium]